MKENIKPDAVWANLHAKSPFSRKRCNFSELWKGVPTHTTGMFDELAFPFCLIKNLG